jgi:hypothetical protein
MLAPEDRVLVENPPDLPPSPSKSAHEFLLQQEKTLLRMYKQTVDEVQKQMISVVKEYEPLGEDEVK